MQVKPSLQIATLGEVQSSESLVYLEKATVEDV